MFLQELQETIIIVSLLLGSIRGNSFNFTPTILKYIIYSIRSNFSSTFSSSSPFCSSSNRHPLLIISLFRFSARFIFSLFFFFLLMQVRLSCSIWMLLGCGCQVIPLSFGRPLGLLSFPISQRRFHLLFFYWFHLTITVILHISRTSEFLFFSRSVRNCAKGSHFCRTKRHFGFRNA